MFLCSWREHPRADEAQVHQKSYETPDDLAEPTGRPRVAIAHGDRATRQCLATAIKADGYDVFEVSDGCELLEVLADLLLDPSGPSLPDLIIADSALHGRSGFDIVADLRSVGWLVPFFVTTPRGQYEDAVRCKTLARVLVFPVPFLPADICASARAILGPVTAKPRRVLSPEGQGVDDDEKWPAIAWATPHNQSHHHQQLEAGFPGWRHPTWVGSLERAEEGANQERGEREKNRRADIRVSVGLWFEDITQSCARGLYCTNLSSSGAFLCDDQQLHKGQVFSGFFALPHEKVLVHTFCQVMNVRRVGTPRGCGVRFLNLSHTTRSSISRFVERALRQAYSL